MRVGRVVPVFGAALTALAVDFAKEQAEFWVPDMDAALGVWKKMVAVWKLCLTSRYSH